MAGLGLFCQSAGIIELNIENSQLPALEEIPNGLVIELKNYSDTKNFTSNQFLSLLSQINSSFQNTNAASIVSKLKYVKEQKKKLLSKKKVKGYTNVQQLLNKPFLAPVSTFKTLSTETILPVPVPVTAVPDDVDCGNKLKELNLMKYEIKLHEQRLTTVTNEVIKYNHDLNSLKGHYSVKNVSKRDIIARSNLHKLRDAQRIVISQQKLLKSKAIDKSELSKLKYENTKLKDVNAELKDGVVRHGERCEIEKAKKIVLQKSNSYLKGEINCLRSQHPYEYCDAEVDHVDCDETRHKLDIVEKQQQLYELEEELCQLRNKCVETKNDKGVYLDNIRLCVMELAGLEVAVDKMASVIHAVTKHVVGIEIKTDDLPNGTTALRIVDEGHFIAKAFIADKLEHVENWGLGRDGTTRRKQKILDTAVTLDSGDVISLGFTHVARETAETIQTVTKDHLSELASLKDNPEYLADTLRKLSYTMSDRASNEKLADKLLDEWRDTMLQNYEGDKEDVSHFHCMAHVLLGLHNYITPELKNFEQSLQSESGPLGRDALSFFNSWSKKETVVSRVIRTTSDSFGPAGDHLGVRDRWEAFCTENGVKSLISNYRDNRFNALFQTSAKVFLHRADFVRVLETVSKPNLKLKAVKSDLESNEIAALLQCLGLFYLKVTGPYWNLVTCGKVPYLDLYKHVGEIEQFLKSIVTSPEQLLRRDQHWSSSDPLEISSVPHCNRLANALFEINEETRSILMSVIPVVAAAMIKCFKKQLEDFFPGGKFHKPRVSRASTNFAPVTNLACEHHFGDLDSSQKRRPHASFHHHSSIQLLKRNRKSLMTWINKMDDDHKSDLLSSARQGGKQIRKRHKDHELKVMSEINDNMRTEHAKKINGTKRKMNSDHNKRSKRANIQKPPPSVEPIEQLGENDYVAVAYQDNWYPGCVETVLTENTFLIKFMTPCRKDGHYQWPIRDDRQVVEKQFVLCKNFVPDCVGSGRQWFVEDYVKINDVYTKFHAMYF